MFNRMIQSIEKNNLKGMIIVVCYYFTNSLRIQCKNKFTVMLCAPIIILYKLIVDFILSCELAVSTKIGPSLIIHYGRGLVLNANVVIGENVTLKHNITIGNKEGLNGKDLGSPIIGDNVIIGPNTVIIGRIKIGNNVIIGAGSVVVKDVEINCIVAGNPAKFIREIV